MHKVMRLRTTNLNFLRSIQTTAGKKQTEISTTIDYENVAASKYNAARPFDSIPGPKPLPIPRLGNIWRLLPFGTYGNMEYSDVHILLNKKYGPIVKFTGLGDMDHVLLFEPELIEQMFRNEAVWPHRRPLSSLKYYRDVIRKDFYEDKKGLVTSNGEDWYKFRTATNPVMLQPKNVKSYLNSVDEVSNDFLERLRYLQKKHKIMPDNFMEEFNKVTLEVFASMALDTRIGCLSSDLTPDSDKMLLINNVKRSMTLMFYLDTKPPIWQIFPTKKYREFVKSMDFIVDYTTKIVLKKWEEIKNQTQDEEMGNKSILKDLLLHTKDPKMAIVMASDLLFASIDTTSNTMATALYLLAIHPEKQEKLYQELRRTLPNKNTTFTEDILNDLKYTRAVIRESMRLRPTTIVNTRAAGKDMVLNNYQIPKGTEMIACHGVLHKMEKYFKDAEKFVPERWLKVDGPNEYSLKDTNPFVFMPFGFGPRTCIGKRFAYMEMDVIISKIIRNFNVTYHGDPMTWTMRLICGPGKPLKFKMTERSE